MMCVACHCMLALQQAAAALPQGSAHPAAQPLTRTLFEFNSGGQMAGCDLRLLH
jgi:hypothetical protein